MLSFYNSTKWTESFIKDSKGLVSKPSKKKKTKKCVKRTKKNFKKSSEKSAAALLISSRGSAKAD